MRRYRYNEIGILFCFGLVTEERPQDWDVPENGDLLEIVDVLFLEEPADYERLALHEVDFSLRLARRNLRISYCCQSP